MPPSQRREFHSLTPRPTSRLPCSIVWGHNGDFPGYLTNVFNSRDGRRQLAVLVNDDSLPPLADEALQRLLVRAYCG